MAKSQRISGRAIGIGAAILVVVAIIAAIVVFLTPAFSVRSFEVEGNNHVSNEQVIEATGVAEGERLAQVNVSQAAQGVASLPWVQTVTVNRGWPSSLKVSIVEQQAVAYMNESDGTHLLNEKGAAFAIEDPPQEAVEITGDARDNEEVRRAALEVASSISEPTRAQIDSIEARGEYVFVINLDDGRTVVWGASEDNHDKALALDTVLEREGSEFDISNPSQIGVR